MARLTPDPDFYASPSDAAAAPDETHAYVVTLNTGTNGDSAPDALTVIDLENGSSTYGQTVGRLDMPNVGDELHHFGWNACSSALCPWAAHPHIERRYLLVPGLRSSRIHIIDVKDDPKAPKLTKVIEADEIASKTGYSRPHTIHCGPDGIYVSALGAPTATAPAGSSCSTTRLLGQGRLGAGPRPQELAYDFWWHLDQGTVITSEWGTPNMVESGLQPELLLSNQYRPQAPHLGPREAPARPGDRPRRGEPDGARAAPGARPAQGLRLRRRRHLDRGPLGLGLAVGAQRRRHVQGREGHRRPGRARPRPSSSRRPCSRSARCRR